MRFLPLLLASLLVAQAPGYKAEVEKFRANRAEEIGGPTGWAALTGLHWLEGGAHSIGRASANDVVLTAPGSPLSLGTITVDARDAVLRLAPGVTATVDGKPVTTVDFHPPKSPVATMVLDTMTMTLIQRGQRLALRVWDSQSPDRIAFKGLKWYPIDPKWRIDATWTPHTPAPTLDIMNVLNEIVKMPNVGTATFTVNGQTVTLEALLEEPNAQELFFMFRDGTDRQGHVRRRPLSLHAVAEGRQGRARLQRSEEPAVRIHALRDVSAAAGEQSTDGANQGGRAESRALTRVPRFAFRVSRSAFRVRCSAFRSAFGPRSV